MAARAPWGFVPQPSGQYPTHPGPYPPPEDPRHRPPFPQPEVGGFYNPVLSAAVQQSQYPPPHAQPYGHPLAVHPGHPGHHNHLSHSQSYHPPAHYHQSPPTNSTSHIPHVLKPGGPSRSSTNPATRSNSSDLFFQQPPPALPAFPQPQPQPQPTYPTQHPEHPPLRHAYTSPAGPPVPQKPYIAPPIPPKPSISSPPAPGPSSIPLYPQQIAASSSMQPQNFGGQNSLAVYNDMKEQMPIQSSPKMIDEEAEFKRILALSAQESVAREEHRKKTLTREDEELERALQESLRLNSYPEFSLPVTASPQGPAFPFPEVGPSPIQASPSSPPPGPEPSPSFPFPQQLTPHTFEPEAPRENLQAGQYTSSPTRFADQIAADEAFARRLLEEEQERSQSQPPPQAPPLRPTSQPRASPPPPSQTAPPVPAPFSSQVDDAVAPPLYNEVVRNSLPQTAPAVAPTGSNSLFPTQSAMPPPSSSPSPGHSRASSPKPNLARHSSANAVPTPSPVDGYRFEKAKSMIASTSKPLAGPTKRNSSGNNSLATPSSNGHGLSTSPSSSNLAVPPDNGNRRMSVTSHSSEPPMTANQYVDAELLRGVCKHNSTHILSEHR